MCNILCKIIPQSLDLLLFVRKRAQDQVAHQRSVGHTPLSWSQSGEEAPLHWLRGPRRGEACPELHTESGLCEPEGLATSRTPVGQEEDRMEEEEGQEER